MSEHESCVFVKCKSGTEEKVKALLGKFGTIQDTSKFNLKRGNAVVYFASENEAKAAIEVGQVDEGEIKMKISAYSPTPKKAPTKPKASKSKPNKNTKPTKSEPKETESAVESFDPKGIYIQGLQKGFDFENLKTMFEKFGTISKSKKVRGVNASIVYEEASSVDQALKSTPQLFEGHDIVIQKLRESKPVAKKPAEKKAPAKVNGAKATAAAAPPPKPAAPKQRKAERPRDKVKVMFLDKNTTQAEVEAAMGTFGEIKSVDVIILNAIADLSFSSEDERNKAMDEKSIDFNGSTLRIQADRAKRDPPTNCGIHVSGFTEDKPSEESVKEAFSKYGSVVDVSIKSKRAVARVQYTDAGAALKASENPEGINLKVHDEGKVIVELLRFQNKFQNKRKGNQKDKTVTDKA